MFRRDGDPISIQLLDFAKTYSADGQIVSPSIKSNATFGFYIKGQKRDGQPAKLMFFYITLGWDERLKRFAREAEQLAGKEDAKLQKAIKLNWTGASADLISHSVM